MRISRMYPAAVLAGSLLLLLSGCGPKDDGGDTGISALGGFVTFIKVVTPATSQSILAAQADFFSATDPEQSGFFLGKGLDNETCTTFDGTATGGTFTVTRVDVGDPITFTDSSANALTLARSGAGTTAAYGPGTLPDATAILPGAWDVELPGDTVSGSAAATWAGGLILPDEMAVSAPDMTQTLSLAQTDVDVTWTAGNGDSVVVILFSTGGPAPGAIHVQCRTADDGSFTLPSSFFADVAQTGTFAVVRFKQTTQGYPAGRTVLLEGSTQASTAYNKT